jgi:predicted AAA+ superfamily ATPase
VLLFDLGVRNAILRRPLDRPLDDERGLLLEHLVGLELRRRESTIWPEVRVQHFRTRRGAEVDFVLSVGREHWAIEVKSSRQVDARDLKGIGAFVECARKVTRRIVVFLGARRQQLDDVEVLPIEHSLTELPG